MITASIKCQKCKRTTAIEYDDSMSRQMADDHCALVCGTSRFFVHPATPGEGIFKSACCGAIMTYAIEES